MNEKSEHGITEITSLLLIFQKKHNLLVLFSYSVKNSSLFRLIEFRYEKKVQALYSAMR